MSFWQLNKKKVIRWFVILFIAFFLLFFYGVLNEKYDYSYRITCSLVAPLFLLAFIFLLYCVPVIKTFWFINKLVADEGQLSIIPAFDKSYSISYEHTSSWWQFVTPVVEAYVQDLPVVIDFEPGSRSGPPCLTFKFFPMKKAGSKRIYTDYLCIRLGRFRKIKHDLKPEVLEFAAKLKESGFSSGAGLPVSTQHFEQYE